MLIQTYKCDLCKEEYKDKNSLCGLDFTSLTSFKLAPAQDTEGTHICKSCLEQIIEQGNWFEQQF